MAKASYHLCLQIGETAQIQSGGLLRATPHAVRSIRSNLPISRESFAVFMEPEFDAVMTLPEGVTAEDALAQGAAFVLPQGVPALADRWTPGITFGEFTERTLAAYW